jgi:N-methylhydantoinase B
MSAVTANTIDPITVEVIGSALSSIVEEMGEALVRASFSTNIKERRDCSTALFDTRGTTCARPSISQCISAALSGSSPKS